MKDYKNIHEMVKATVDANSGKAAYRWFKTPTELNSITWGEFYDRCKQAAKSLMALGLKPGEKVNIISNTRLEWVLSDMATIMGAGVTVGIYQSNLPKDVQYIVDHSEASYIFVENDLQLKKILEIKANIPNIRKVIMFDGTPPADAGDYVLSFDDFIKQGEGISDEEFAERANTPNPEDLAAMVYTSGTTGVPKGAMLSHRNLTFTPQTAAKCLDLLEDDEQFLFLPLAHVFARIAVYFSLTSSVPVTFARSIETVVDDLGVAKPTFFASVPRIYEKVYTRVLGNAEAAGGVKLKIFRWALGVGKQVSDLKIQGKEPGGLLAIKAKIAHKLVFSKLHDRLGGRVRLCVSGAAPLNADIAKFFHGAGILVLEGLGMTENSSFTNVNRMDNYRFGWVGLPGEGIEQKIADDGEIMYHGPNVMMGYYKMPEETEKTFREIDGKRWLLTGDLGEIDEHNFLRITGRKKDLIITAGGKNIAPSAIEGLIATSKYINQISLYGDKQKFLVGVVTLDPENTKEFCKNEGIEFDENAELLDEKLLENEKVKSLIDAEIAEKNKQLASFETVKKVILRPEFTIENGLLTPSMKVKKNKVIEKYEKDLLALYS